MAPASHLTPPAGVRSQQRQAPLGGKVLNMPPPQGGKMPVQQFPGNLPTKRDIIFPPDSVEAVTPLLYKRKRLGKSDVGPVDMWRIFMCLQSGLLSESTWALDVLNILLFDDSAVQYFGLSHLPGLLSLLLDHFQKSLSDMFESKHTDCTNNKRTKKLTNTDTSVEPQNEHDNNNDKTEDSIDLGQVTKLPNLSDRLLILESTTNYTLVSRKGIPVKIRESNDDIFVLDTKRDWDVDLDKTYHLNGCNGEETWTYGHTEANPFDHLISPFKAEYLHIPFAKYLKKTNRKETNVSNETSETKDTKDVKDSKQNEEAKSTLGQKDNKNEINKEQNAAEENGNEKSDDETSATKKDAKDEATTNCKEDNNVDSDCREVDMELEKLSNTQQNEESSGEKINGKDTKLSENATNVSSFDLKSTINDPAKTLKRRKIGDYEDECYARDEATLYLISEGQDILARRCISISNILRNLTFVPGNELVFANSETFLIILGKILLLHHTHPVRTQTIRNYDREDDGEFGDSCSSLQGETEWWWDYLIQLRENMMVAIANIAGHLQLSQYDENITRPCLDGLLHWAVCPSAYGQDPFPSCPPHSALSPQRLALEALCKICVTDANVDLVIATPPFSRLESLCSVLTRHLCRNEDQVLREFSVNLLHYLAAADSAMARTVALQSPCISYLVAFIEQAEQTALGVANQHGISYLRENPDSMGTSLDMLRRAAGTLLHLARHPDNRPLFLQQEQRLLGLVMSHILDQQVALIISRVLFQVSRGTGPVSIAEGNISKTSKGQFQLATYQ